MLHSVLPTNTTQQTFSAFARCHPLAFPLVHFQSTQTAD